MKRVMLSGASGYFGSLAKRYLLEQGFEVLTAGRKTYDDLYFDLTNPFFFSCARYAGVDCFIHTAAANERICSENPQLAILQNVAGTRAALEFSVQNNIPNFCYISTFHVYGVDAGLVDEGTLLTPKNDYGLTHLQAEQYVKLYTQKGLINGFSLRPANMFDPPDDIATFNRWSLIPFEFCKSALDKDEIRLTSPGHQLRNFVSVRDVVNIIMSCLEGEFNGETINVPGVDTYSVLEFAYLVKDTLAEEFERDIKVIAPRGKKLEAMLRFESKYFSPFARNFSSIKGHIIELCRVV